jgi:hypothetical protein
MNSRIALFVALLLAGCATTPTPPAPGTATPPPAAEPPRPGQPPPNVLAAELKWMQALFDGTPVVIVMETDGAMRVDVPLTFAFDANSSAPMPPLRAVMDKVATTLTRQPSAKLQLGAPNPAARERNAAMRKYLLGRGVIALRVSTLASAPAELVTMRVVPGPVAIERLDDSALPATTAFPAARAASRPAP